MEQSKLLSGKPYDNKMPFVFSFEKIGLHIANFITVHISSPGELESGQFYPILGESALIAKGV